MTDPGFSSTARQQVQEILSRPPYRPGPDRTPRPLAGVFHAIGRVLRTVVTRPVQWLYHHLLLRVSHSFTVAFGGWWPLAAGILAVGGGVLVAVVLARRRARVAAVAPGTAPAGTVEDPRQLEERAAAAATEGDHETAVRLRFRAGLLHLARRGLLVDWEAASDRRLSAALASQTFTRLAGTHERIVYGRRPATVAESEEARRGWPQVVGEVRAGRATVAP